VLKKEKEVLAFVRGLDCQLDNLCHFLPQEMVKVFRDVAGRYGVDFLRLFSSLRTLLLLC
jgi:hypothetical protein